MRFSPLKAFFPTADDVLAADRDRLAETLLWHLKTYEGGGTVHQPVGGFNRDYYIALMAGQPRYMGTLPTQPEYGDRQPEVSRRMQEAWNWAVVKGYLMHNPGQLPDFFVITSDGEQLLSRPRLEQRENLGVEQLNPELPSDRLGVDPAKTGLTGAVVGDQPGVRGNVASNFKGQVEKTVFISYRRTNVSWALAIFQDLNSHGFDVFFDYDGIASGAFEQVILGNIRARAHFLVLLTPAALERCGDPTDWLRREIEAALDARRNIVPLMLEGFDFGAPAIASHLTGRLAALRHYNGLNIPAAYFSAAMERLRGKYLSVPLDAVLHPASPSAERAAREQEAAAKSAPLVSTDRLTVPESAANKIFPTVVDLISNEYDAGRAGIAPSEKMELSSPDDLKIRIVSGANSNATRDGLILYFVNGRDDPIQPSNIAVINAASFNSRKSRFRTTENYQPVPIGSYLKTEAGHIAKQPPDRESAWLVRIMEDHLELSGNVGRILKWPADDPSTREVWSLTLSVQTKGLPAWNPKLCVEWERGSKKIFVSPL